VLDPAIVDILSVKAPALKAEQGLLKGKGIACARGADKRKPDLYSDLVYGKILKMSWALKGLAGPLKDKTYTVKSGITMGRQGDIVIPDLKASGQHARIRQLSNGKWIVEDTDSKNGTRIEGERITRVYLTDGLRFFIGDQGFEVIEIKEDMTATGKPQAAQATAAPPPPRPAGATRSAASTPSPPDLEIQQTPDLPPPAPPPKPQRYWHEVLAEFVGENLKEFSDQTKPLAPLDPALVLEFSRGLQVNSRWILGYGPRLIGSNSLDLPIWEPGAPAVCFEVSPSPDGILFKTSHPDIVRVNGERVDSKVLHVGDTIQINETLIEVDFSE
jgi:pSer/pThr/pTyr-binding forkhead associated (FHA) protein